MAATSLTLDPVRTSLESWPLAETLATPATAVGSLPARTTNADVERQLGRLHTRGITLLHHLIQFGLAHRDSRQTLDDLLVHYHNTTNLDGVMATSVSVLIRFCEAYGRVEYTRHIHPSRLAQVLATSPKLAHRHSCVSAGPHRPPAVRTSKGFWTTRPSRIPPSTIAGTYKACLVLTYLVDLCGTRRLQQTVDSLYGEELRYLFAPAALYAAPQSAGPCTQPSGHLFMCDQILAAVSRLHRLQLASTSTSTSTTLT
ncbi:hypothetical protein BC831DRAFT_178248 [Entophlyctis helioformis]|nr:hypothetical protein BC831DRAFT_178248 [Entophlyctis helioformis]